MAGISPTSGVTGPQWHGTVSSAPAGPAASEKASFADALRGYIGKVDGDQQASAEAIRDLLAGRTEDILPVVSAVARADLSFRLLLGVRNKVIEAYKQTINMQV